jgi:hypothetical protein
MLVRRSSVVRSLQRGIHAVSPGRYTTLGRGAIAAFGVALFVACGTPCKDLSDTICKCEPTDALQQACLQRVDAESQAVPLTEAEQDVCAGILDAETCTCDALADGDLVACGLAIEGR